MIHTSRDWAELTRHEPRLADIANVAVAAVLNGADPDVTYTQVKPFLSYLAGPSRGGEPGLDARRIGSYDQQLTAVLAKPAPHLDAVATRHLDQLQARDVAINHVYDLLLIAAEETGAHQGLCPAGEATE